jgi:hypothetical protein
MEYSTSRDKAARGDLRLLVAVAALIRPARPNGDCRDSGGGFYIGPSVASTSWPSGHEVEYILRGQNLKRTPMVVVMSVLLKSKPEARPSFTPLYITPK